ncbi:hypothetical protein GCM10023224_01700 [Streptomonospora halophila]|uniref:Alanine-rich protein n=1 Tax=Streptomonospora halophila TaxID=427369 RepID=A0ABP9G2I8_9ACTN
MNTVYAYPWDVVGDPGAPDRLAGLGAGSVAVAASYHTARAATPRHPGHRFVHARHAACYVPVTPDAWQGSRLVPGRPDWVAGDDSFAAARTALRAAGLAVPAWVVLTHNSLLGAAHPDLTVRNAFGEHYEYALCPASAEVRDYCARLVAEVVALGEPDGLILEACGPLGVRHGGHHEKTEGAEYTPVQLDLLSLCCCAACDRRYRDAGVDPADLVRRVRAGVDAAEPPPSVEEALGPLAAPVRRVRTGLAAELRSLLLGRARELRPGIRVAVHASADAWATGPFATVADDPGGPAADCLVGTCWTPDEEAAAGLAGLAAQARPADADVGAYVLALPPRPADPADLERRLDLYADAGATEFHVYHGGLASARRLAQIRRALAERAAPAGGR